MAQSSPFTPVRYELPVEKLATFLLDLFSLWPLWPGEDHPRDVLRLPLHWSVKRSAATFASCSQSGLCRQAVLAAMSKRSIQPIGPVLGVRTLYAQLIAR